MSVYLGDGGPFDTERGKHAVGEEHECCEGGHPATRLVYPYLDDDPGVYAVCDDDSHSPVDRPAEIEHL